MTEKPETALKKEDVGKDAGIALLETRVDSAAPNENMKTFVLSSDDEEARIRMALDQGVFIGFTKEELLKFERDPGWRRLRLVLLILFWLAWALCLLAAVVVIVFVTPACPVRPAMQWPENWPIYEINVPSFRIGSRCTNAPTEAGDVEGIIDVLTALRDNYFDQIHPADTFWLRWDNMAKGPSLENDLSSPILKLFEAAKKRQRRILLDLLPYQPESNSVTLGSLECGIFAGSKLRESANAAPFRCFNQEADLEKMIKYIDKYRNTASGFVLDYSKWLLKSNGTVGGESPLKKLVDAVRGRSGSEAVNNDGAKHLIMRFPVLDKRFLDEKISREEKDKLIKERRDQEKIAREAGIRLIIETVAMNVNDPEACSSLECLKELVHVVPTFSNTTDAYRAFAIDDPSFRGRTSAGTQWKSGEALAAFAITVLPGNPVIYYGSEIGMTSDSTATSWMQWTDLDNNTCSDQYSYMCFCNSVCKGDPGMWNRTCPHEASQVHLASVREQVRGESKGLLKSVIRLLEARQTNDSLNWGKSQLTLDSHSHKILIAIRKAEEFERFGLFISLGEEQSMDSEVVPKELPGDACYQTIYSFFNGETSLSSEKRHFKDMVLKKNEVRLVRIFKSC